MLRKFKGLNKKRIGYMTGLISNITIIMFTPKAGMDRALKEYMMGSHKQATHFSLKKFI